MGNVTGAPVSDQEIFDGFLAVWKGNFGDSIPKATVEIQRGACVAVLLRLIHRTVGVQNAPMIINSPIFLDAWAEAEKIDPKLADLWLNNMTDPRFCTHIEISITDAQNSIAHVWAKEMTDLKREFNVSCNPNR